MTLSIRLAEPRDAALVLDFIEGLAAYEKLSHEVEADEAMVREALFGENPRAFCDIAEWSGEPAGFALWFYNFSTFRGRHGLYLEDLFVKPAFRGKGIGKGLLVQLAQRCVRENLGRFEWSVLDWNSPAIDVYKSIGAKHMKEWQIFRMSGDALARFAGEPV